MKTSAYDTKTDNPSEFFEWLGIPLRREGERSYRTAAFWRGDVHASVSIFYGTKQTWLYTDNSIGQSGDIFSFLKRLGLTTDDVRQALAAFESGAPVPDDVAAKIETACGYEVEWPAHRSGANAYGSGVRDIRRIPPSTKMKEEAKQYRGMTDIPNWLLAYNVEFVGGRTHDMWAVHQGMSDVIELCDAMPHADGGMKMTLGKKRPLMLGTEKERKIAVVEGIWDAVAAHMMGYRRVCCLFSTAMAEKAAEILALQRNVDEIILMLDNDESGKTAEKTMLEYLANPLSTSPYADGFDPETCQISTLQPALETVGLKDASDLWVALQGAQWGQAVGLEPTPICLPEPQPKREKQR